MAAPGHPWPSRHVYVHAHRDCPGESIELKLSYIVGSNSDPVKVKHAPNRGLFRMALTLAGSRQLSAVGACLAGEFSRARPAPTEGSRPLCTCHSLHPAASPRCAGRHGANLRCCVCNGTAGGVEPAIQTGEGNMSWQKPPQPRRAWVQVAWAVYPAGPVPPGACLAGDTAAVIARRDMPFFT